VSDFEISATLNSDSEGLIGQECASCSKYFKVEARFLSQYIKATLFCPYCGVSDHRNSFLTQDQKEYLKSLVSQEFLKRIEPELRALEQEPDLNALFSIGIKIDIPEVTIRQYSERILRKKILCGDCSATYAVYGISFFCPFSGSRKPTQVFTENFDSIKLLINLQRLLSSEPSIASSQAMQLLKDYDLSARLLEKALEDIVTAFETYCKTVYLRQIGTDQEGSKRRKEIGNSFQNFSRADELLNEAFGFRIGDFVSKSDLNRMSILFEKRHIVTHNSGIVDQKYIDRTRASQSLLGTKIAVSEAEIEFLLERIAHVAAEIERKLSSQSEGHNQ
jgi:hypothetical protein